MVSFKENPISKKRFVHKELNKEKIQDMFFSHEVHDVQYFTLADAKTTYIQHQHEHFFKTQLYVSRYSARNKTVKTLKFTDTNEISWVPILFALSTLFLLIIYIYTNNISLPNLEREADENISLDIWNMMDQFVGKYLP